MPICPRRTERILGFTLIEMLVVLTVLGLVGAVMAINVERDPGRSARDASVQRLKMALADARLSARRTGTPAAVDPAALVPGATLAGASAGGPANGLTFYADGSSSGQTIVLAGRPLLEVDWLTGEVRDGR